METEMVVFEHDLREGYLGSPTIFQKVAAFLDLAAREPACFLVVLGSKFLRNRKAFGLGKDAGFRECKLSDLDRDVVLKACTSHGHLSVLFGSPKSDELSRRYLELGFYGQPRQLNLERDESPLDAEAALSLEDFLASANGKPIEEMLAFAHDAGAYYRLYPWRR